MSPQPLTVEHDQDIEKLESKFGAPKRVIFCQNCVLSNQRPTSTIEFFNTKDRRIKTVNIDESGICDACKYTQQKHEEIDWKEREEQLLRLLEKYRRKDGYYDCLVPGSGGKDSMQVAYLLKYKYGMNPLTITWPPLLYTDVGLRNFRRWIEIGGFDNITFKPNGKAQKVLTRLGIENLLHPFQTFILGQKNIAPRFAAKLKIPLIIFGENSAEYGNPLADNSSSLMEKAYYISENLDQVYIGGVALRELKERHGLTMNELYPYLPLYGNDLKEHNIEVHFMGYYVKWIPQENYYHAVEHMNFEANTFRTEGTYSKYSSIDDKVDPFHYYTHFIKFGLGRATLDAAQEIRHKHLTREEGIALINRFDGEFPNRFFKDVMEYVEMDPERFLKLCDDFRSPHLWRKTGDKWELRYKVS
ncbi:MAG: N-acetyl sugar amidotransferase [Elusimicrobia bacterium]|nr:N-acetyl sugar amidotransferase [Elusimicrobiota bacterium]